MATTVNTYYDDSLTTVLGVNGLDYVLNTITHIASKSIYAVVDAQTLEAIDLELIASKSVEITSQGGDIHAAFSSGNALKIESSGDGIILRNYLDVSNVSVLDTDTSGRELRVTGTDGMSTTHVGGLSVKNNLGYAILFTNQPEGILVNDVAAFVSNVSIGGVLDVDGNARMRANLAVDGNVFGSTMNVYRDNIVPNSTTSRVGFGFRITDTHQLELVRYSEIDDGTPVSRRMAIFGNTPVSTDESNNTNYLVFNELTGLVSVGGGDGLSPAQTLSWSISERTGALYTNSGMVGIGTDAPKFTLDVNGSFGASNITASEITTTSDNRLKTIDETPMHDAATCLNAIQNLDVISYIFNGDESGRKRTGFNAQQMREVMPDAVTMKHAYGYDDCHVIDTTVVIAYLVNAVRSLSSKIDTMIPV